MPAGKRDEVKRRYMCGRWFFRARTLPARVKGTTVVTVVVKVTARTRSRREGRGMGQESARRKRRRTTEAI